MARYKEFMMTGIEVAYSEAAIKAVLKANHRLCESTVKELLRKTKYGKGDTLGLDAVSEIMIRRVLQEFDPGVALLTEELGQEWRRKSLVSDYDDQALFVSDPTDRSSFFKNFLEALPESYFSSKFRNILEYEDTLSEWEQGGDSVRGDRGGQVLVSGATSALTCILRGHPLISVIVNYISQKMFVACPDNLICFELLGLSESNLEDITLSDIFKGGETFNFCPARKDWLYDQYKKFVTFLGKTGYAENLEAADIFSSEPGEHVLYKEPGGPARILYLSSLYQGISPGFIMSNGEKITEWVHWLPYLMVTDQNKAPLRLYEIFSDRPFMKDGILMAPSPAYSVFSISGADAHNHFHIDVGKIKSLVNPSRYRATLALTTVDNSWVDSKAEENLSRIINFR